ncbi:hypothetical protein WOLCODRAFT_153213 [Wolfiporia cocos MD-104 SS10]|uniref:BTB domain-containing protein n=1 Tax=Wolfiporia cocos (strain MD-104) TaxID=742152 RepID=A0A2H3JNT6_WOLCO|nr:hypothetical protein WOLCODRAFT_153213 [Wolfiporia cocos MD-104 SS10]
MCYFSASGTYTPPSSGGTWGCRNALSRSRHWEKSSAMRIENAVVIIVSVTTDATASVSTSLATADRYTEPTMLGIYCRVIRGDDPAPDVSFVTFTKRSSSGELKEPRLLSAHRDILTRDCYRWESWLDGTNKSSIMSPVTELADWVKTHPAGHMDIDSDIEDDFDDELMTETDFGDGAHSSPQSDADQLLRRRTSSPSSSRGTIFSSYDMGGVGDASVSSKMRQLDEMNDDQMSDISACMQTASQTTVHHNMITVMVTGAASSTWESYLFYLYSGIVVFAPLRSEGEHIRKKFIDNYEERNPHMPAPCSCKSMYRLADELKMGKLKELAFDHLKSTISTHTILTEVFSEFTSRYKEIREMEMGILGKMWSGLVGSPEFQSKLVELAQGDYPHAGEIVGEMFRRFSAG